jgi:ABC-type transporter Mla subunit MlaD
MSNTLGILTAIVLALSAFFAYKNKAAYEDRIAQTQDEKNKLARSTDRYNKAVEDVNATSKEIEETLAETTRLNEETDTRKNTNEDLTLQVETKTGTVNTNKEKLGQVREMASRIPDQKELANQLREYRAQFEELGQSITAAEGRLANLTANNNDAQERADTIRTRLDTFTAGRSLPTLDTRIRTIYPTWGFVTLAAGNNSGVVANSTLNIMRGGEVIGKLLVTAVESGSASASIVPDSLSEDTVLMVGDRVVAASAEQ